MVRALQKEKCVVRLVRIKDGNALFVFENLLIIYKTIMRRKVVYENRYRNCTSCDWSTN